MTKKAQPRGFNSKLVRLKGYLCHLMKKDKLQFQFQTGSIKSNAAPTETTPDGEFQFQTGSIKSLTSRGAYVKIYFVSIPNWFD